MKRDELLERLTRIEDKLDSHLEEHKWKFNILTRAVIPGTSIVVSIVTACVSHLFGKHN